MKTANKKPIFMGKGTTPCIHFSFPYKEERVQQIVVSFKGEQSGYLIEKWYRKGAGENNDIVFSENPKGAIILEVTLSQQDTMGSELKPGFEENEKIIMSIKPLIYDENENLSVPYCAPMYTYMGRVLYEAELKAEEDNGNEQ